MFLFIRATNILDATEKKVQLARTFFQLLANDGVKVNKTYRISAKIDLELDLFSKF